MANSSIELWAQNLLDVGKRNNLVNFRDTKSSSLELVYPNMEDVFAGLSGTKTYEIFSPKLIDSDEGDITDTDEENTVNDRKSLTKDEYIKNYASFCTKGNHVLFYNKSRDTISVCKNIEKKSHTAIEETGVNIAYIAFGFICWYESERSDVVLRAPILLIPVELSNDSAISPHCIKALDDDVIVNPTFNYMLSAQYNISLPDYDEGGLDDYLTTIESTVKKLGWSIERTCKLGTFSFQKINMYQDLISNQAKILENDIIRGLLGEHTVETQDSSINGEGVKLANPLLELCNVVDADSSQIEAIELAKAGKSFVLQGPPGTGKSQTITNIIAECLNDGKKVLFVSEKLAALSVVYDKLKKAGLEEFCLELHSHKANKKTVIDDLCHTLAIEKTHMSTVADQVLEEKIQAQRKLDFYEKALHKKHAVIDKSLFNLFDCYSSCRDTDDIAAFISEIQTKDLKFLGEMLDILNSYEAYATTVGYDYKRHAWYGYNNRINTFDEKADVKQALELCKEKCNAMLDIAWIAKNKLNIDLSTAEDMVAWGEFFELASKSTTIVPALLNKNIIETIGERITYFSDLSKVIIENKSTIAEHFDENIYSIPAANYHKKLTKVYSSFGSRLFNHDYKSIIEDIQLCSKSGKKPSYKEAIEILENLLTYYGNIKKFKTEEIEIKELLGSEYKGYTSDFDKISEDIALVKGYFSNLNGIAIIAQMSPYVYEENKVEFARIYTGIEENLDTFKESVEGIQKFFDSSIFNFIDMGIIEIYRKVNECLDNFDSLDNWYRFTTVLSRIESTKLTGFITAAIQNKIPVEQFSLTYKKMFYRQWIQYILDNSSGLPEFDRIAHDIAVEKFIEKDKVHLEINKAKIKETLSARRPSTSMVAGGSEVAILMREGEKKRKIKSIRNLLDECGNLVQILKPCFLMSPLSVSTFLAPNSIKFDVVVFDEASQVFPQDAIGAIYRGSQLIVVGDSKQMPPTNFFNATVDIDYSEEDSEEDIRDFESILDMCSTFMPIKRLGWHYRSRYESLILFSNAEFYDNHLVTFPSSKSDTAWIGVDYYHVDGTIERKNHTNLKDAEFIVNLIYENIEKFPDRSLGVVAFNIGQQALIEKLLDRRRQAEPMYEDFFAGSKKEPFFVKNLETVQGDERDTIILDITYAKDSTGRFIRSFGPLSNAGGERRLNVAVTRAKDNIQVVSSLHAYDIDLEGIQSRGTILLRNYLDYAENGIEALERTINVNPQDEFDSEFEMEVCDFLRANGFSIDTQVGCSGFRIDLGLKRKNSSDYVLAIECDGASYHSSKNARDRDRLRQSILENMGWKFYRIWSTDWYLNKLVEKKNLLDVCRAALDSKNENVSSSNKDNNEEKNQISFEIHDSANAAQKRFCQYELATIDGYHATTSERFQKFIKEILEREAPLSEEWLLKRISYMFGREKVTNIVRDRYESLMRNCTANCGIVRRNDFLYLQGQRFKLRVPNEEDEDTKREIKYIAPEELAAGILVLIKENVSVDKASMYHLLASLLGYKSAKSNCQQYFDYALNLLLRINCIEIEDNLVKLKSK